MHLSVAWPVLQMLPGEQALTTAPFCSGHVPLGCCFSGIWHPSFTVLVQTEAEQWDFDSTFLIGGFCRRLLNAPLGSQQVASSQWVWGLKSTAKCAQWLQYVCVLFTLECVNLMCVSFGWPCLEMGAGQGWEHHFEGELF